MRTYLLTIFLLCIGFVLSSQNLDPEVHQLQINQDEEIFFNYSLSEGETLYGLSKKFDCNLSDLKALNADTDFRTFSLGQNVKIPFNSHSSYPENENLLFIYIVRPKETLYTISKKYFNKNVSEIMQLNNLDTPEIGIGQELTILKITNGNFPDNVKEMSKDVEELTEASIISQDKEEEKSIDEDRVSDQKKISLDLTISEIIDLIDDEYSETGFLSEDNTPNEIQSEAQKQILQKGIAYTEKVVLSSDDLFVLHPNAKVNSKMEINYPMLNTSAIATVISDLPSELYPSNVSVVISPSVAKALGAKDDQFRVEMKYIEE